jgi:DNA-binding NarL/FixJ family response regulator
LNQSSWPLIKRWTDEEHAQLKTMAAEGARVDEIALALNRSEKAVRARAAQHGIELRLVAVKSRSRRMPG